MYYQDYIKTELLILIPVLYFIGIWLKKSKVKDKWIPFVLGISSVVLSAVWIIATTDISDIHEASAAIFTAITQGILIAGASVYANQLYIQGRKEE